MATTFDDRDEPHSPRAFLLFDEAHAVTDDPRVHTSTGYTSQLGIGLSCFSSVLSFLSAILTMFIIHRSRQKLTTVYHRLIMSFACTDLLFSIAMAFSTLALPVDMIYTEFKGIIAGNMYTCRAQGFLRTFSSLASLICLAGLALHFLFTIRYKLPDTVFQKRMEPFIYLVMIVYPLGIAVTLLVYDFYQPTPYSTTCRAASYLYWCTDANNSTIQSFSDGNDQQCSSSTARGISANNLFGLKIALSILFISTISIILISFILIVVSVSHQESEAPESVGMRDTSQVNHGRRKIRAIMIHALAYVLTFAWTSSMNFYALVSNEGQTNTSYEIQIADCIIRPLRGLFNLIIFVGLKMYNYRCFNPNVSFFESLIIVIQGRNSDVITLSHLSLVDLDRHNHSSSMEASFDYHGKFDSASDYDMESSDVIFDILRIPNTIIVTENNDEQSVNNISSLSTSSFSPRKCSHRSYSLTLRRKSCYISHRENNASESSCGQSIDTPCGFVGGSICDSGQEELPEESQDGSMKSGERSKYNFDDHIGE